MDPKVTELYNDYIHGDMPRRSFLKQLAVITGGATVSSAVLALIEPNYALGQQITPQDKRLEQGYITYEGTQGPVKAYFARPTAANGPLPGIIVIHENRGLNAHIEDVARRAALNGFIAIAPDGLSYVGGAPEDQEKARDKFREADTDTITADVIRGIAYLKSRPGRFIYVHTPKHGSWLNMIESAFSKMARSFLRHIRVSSKEELKERILKGISEINETPVVFRWKQFELDAA